MHVYVYVCMYAKWKFNLNRKKQRIKLKKSEKYRPNNILFIVYYNQKINRLFAFFFLLSPVCPMPSPIEGHSALSKGVEEVSGSIQQLEMALKTTMKD